MLLWIAICYLSRAVLLPLAVGLTSIIQMGPDSKALLQSLADFNTLLPSAIAAAVFVAAWRRAPGASRPIRWIWAHGRLLLAVAALLDFGISIAELPVWHGEAAETPPGSLLTAALDLYFLAYVIFARHVRDVFADFPPAEMR